MNLVDIERRYKSLVEIVKMRENQVKAFISFLAEETSWLSAPASTRFHNNFEKGLLAHSISVTEALIKIKEILAPFIHDESCVIVGLFHDVGKVGLPGKPMYLHNPDLRHESKKYIVNPELIYIGLGVRSLRLISQFIPLSEEEAQAIVYHDGQYVEENRTIAHREEPLTLLLSYADNWAGCVLERKSHRLYR